MSQNKLSAKIQSIEQATETIKNWSDQGKIVFTNGVFDLIHPGHVLYLEEAKSLGTRLIVGLNSDDSAKRLGKASNRPINDENSRALVIAALESVDLVVLFDQDTPLDLITTLKPNVLVKGGDYSIDQIVGSELVIAMGGKVDSLPFVEGYSTTTIEQRILNAGLDQ
jgi:rfaE bifunctional protein nucleotidyltransferase chain/domain